MFTCHDVCFLPFLILPHILSIFLLFYSLSHLSLLLCLIYLFPHLCHQSTVFLHLSSLLPPFSHNSSSPFTSLLYYPLIAILLCLCSSVTAVRLPDGLSFVVYEFWDGEEEWKRWVFNHMWLYILKNNNISILSLSLNPWLISVTHASINFFVFVWTSLLEKP